MKREWLSPGRYDKELAIQPGSWSMKKILGFPSVKSVLSLGPSTGINEYVLAVQHPEIDFTLIDQNRHALSQAEDGIWHIQSDKIRMTLRKWLQANDMDTQIIQDDSGFRAHNTPNNVQYIYENFPLPHSKKYDVCIAFNCLPAVLCNETRVLYRWVFDRIENNGLFTNEWGLFQKDSQEIRRVLPEGTVSKDIDYLEKVLNPFIFGINS